jgi:hypothetical protein
MGRASSIFNTSRQVASSLGVAIFASTLMNRLSHHAAELGEATTRNAALTSFQETFIFGAALSIVGIVASLSIDDRKIAQGPPSQPASNGDFAFERPEPVGATPTGASGRQSAGTIRRAGHNGLAKGDDA